MLFSLYLMSPSSNSVLERLKIRYGDIPAGQSFTHWHSPSVPPPSWSSAPDFRGGRTKLSVTAMLGKYIYINSADSKVIIKALVQMVLCCFFMS